VEEARGAEPREGEVRPPRGRGGARHPAPKRGHLGAVAQKGLGPLEEPRHPQVGAFLVGQVASPKGRPRQQGPGEVVPKGEDEARDVPPL